MEELKLPNEITKAQGTSPRDLCIVSQPKMGKSVIFGDFTTKFNGIILDLEKGGYEYISARKISTYTNQDMNIYDSYKNYIKIRKMLLESKGKYDYLLIDGLSDLDVLSEIGGTFAYMNTVIGKKFNRKDNIPDGEKLEFGDINWKSVLILPDGAGYQYTRKWFLEQIEIYRQIAPFRIYGAHVSDKYIRDNGKEEVIGSEISLTGKLKTIFAAKVTALAKLSADGDERFLNFDVLNDSIIAGSRSPQLKGRITISKQDKEGNIETFWNKIYK